MTDKDKDNNKGIRLGVIREETLQSEGTPDMHWAWFVDPRRQHHVCRRTVGGYGEGPH